MRKLSAFLLSLLTVVGGHILNRRTDKALFFFGLFLIAALFNLFFYPLLSLAGGTEMIVRFANMPLFLPATIAASLGLVVLLSAVVSFLDAGKPLEDSSFSVSAVIGGLFALLTVLPVTAYMANYALINLSHLEASNDTEVADAEDGDSEEESDSGWGRAFSGSSSHFWENLSYSFGWTPDENLSPLPEGDATLSGRIDYQGKPAAGVTLTGVFNDQYLSKEITTDDEGRFTFELPAGDWRLNRIHTTAWSNKPRGRRSFTLVGSPHQRLTEKAYHDLPEYGAKGLALTASTTPQTDPALEITIRDNLSLDWPDREALPASLSDDTLRWQPVEQAATYQVQLQRITREGSTTSYRTVYWNNTEATALPLAQIRTTSDTDDSLNEYGVLVHAFDDSGRLLTSSPEHFPARSLVLEGRQIPSMQQFPSLASDASAITEAEIEQMQRERKLIDAAMLLAEEAMPAAARQLAGKIDSKHNEERQDTLEGLILTAEGKCEEARRHFETINKKWQRDCLPDFYEQRCQSAQQDEVQ